jgi:hypothetical protein
VGATLAENGDIGNFDPGDSMLTPQTNFHFSKLNFYLKRLPQNEIAPTAKLSALF